MSEYFSETGRETPDAFLTDIRSLISDIEERKIRRYISAAAGMPEEFLDDLDHGKAVSDAELLAVCSAVCYCSERLHDVKLEEISRTAEEIRLNWMEKRFDKAVDAMNIVNNLLDVSGKEDEGQFLNAYHFFMDASSLCSDYMPVFLDKLLPAMRFYECPLRIIVPQAVVNCLNEWSKNPEQEEVSKASRGLGQIKRIQDAGFLSVRGDEGDSTMMSTFISAFSRFKPSYSMVLVTQDKVLANAVGLLNSSGVEGNDILIASLGKDGILSMWFQKEKDSQVEAIDDVEDCQEVMEDFVTTEEDLEDIVNLNHLLYVEEEPEPEEDWPDSLEPDERDAKEESSVWDQVDSWSTLE